MLSIMELGVFQSLPVFIILINFISKEIKKH